jgi:hypothetical protein
MIPKSGVRFSDKIMHSKEGGEAPKGACQPCPRMRKQVYAVCATHLQARLRASIGGAPAFRRHAAALATGYHPDGSAPEPGFLKARRTRCFARSPHDALS